MNFDFDRYERSNNIHRFVRSALIWLAQITVVVLLAYLFVNYGLQKISIVGNSMETTLNEGDSIIVNKMAYRFGSPERNDVIVFTQEGREHSYYNVKRVVALPGDTIQIKDGIIYVNDQEFEERVNVEPIENAGILSSKYTLEQDEYFVLGDNRNHSVDSRFASIGTVVKENIIGKAWVRLNGFAFVSSLNTKTNTEVTAEE